MQSYEIRDLFLVEVVSAIVVTVPQKYINPSTITTQSTNGEEVAVDEEAAAEEDARPWTRSILQLSNQTFFYSILVVVVQGAADNKRLSCSPSFSCALF